MVYYGEKNPQSGWGYIEKRYTNATSLYCFHNLTVVISCSTSCAVSDQDIDRLTTYTTILGRATACGINTKKPAERVGKWMDKTFSPEEKGTYIEIFATWNIIIINCEDEWPQIFPDPVIANATIDRVFNRAELCLYKGRSYRLKDKIEVKNIGLKRPYKITLWKWWSRISWNEVVPVTWDVKIKVIN